MRFVLTSFLASSLVASTALLTACGGSSSAPPGGGIDPGIDLGTREGGAPTSGDPGSGAASPGAPKDAGAETGAAAGADAGVVNGCASWTDRTGSGRTVDGPDDTSPAPYKPSCIEVRKGQSVMFESGGIAYFDYLRDHPLEPFGGDANSPIASTSAGESASFVFPNEGVFGFRCAKHPDVEKGAVKVVP